MKKKVAAYDPNFPTGGMYYVSWWDSRAYEGWRSREGTPTASRCETLGFAIGITADVVSLAQSVADSGNVCSVICIPRKAIIAMTQVKVS